MKLYTYCKKCEKSILFSIKAKDRFELAKKRGKGVLLTCSHCKNKANYHVNEIKAEKNRVVIIIATCILFFGTIGLFIFIWPYLFKLNNIYAIASLIAPLSIPFFIFQFINQFHGDRVSDFNGKKYF